LVSVKSSEELVPSKIKPWASLAYRDYRLLWGSNIFAQIGQHMRQLVNYYLVYDITGSTVQLGLTGLFQLFPMLLLGLFGGTLADLMNRKKLIIITMGAGFLIPLGLWFLAFNERIEVWHIFAAVTVTSFVNVFGGPARSSMLARTVPKNLLMNAFTINTGSMQSTMLLGPFIAGLVIAGLGVANGYFISSFLFFPAMIGVSLLRTSGAPDPEAIRNKQPGFGPFVSGVLKSAWEGARFVWSQRLLMSIFALDIGVTVVSYFRPLLAAFAKDVYKVGPTHLGIITASVPLGSILGATFLLLASGIRRKGLMIFIATFMYSVCLGLFGLTATFWLAAISVGALGFFDSISMTIKHATVQIVTPDHLRGRASSALSMAAMTANASGTLEVGLLAAWVGPQNAMLIGSGICLAVVLIGWMTLKTLKNYRS
jgi:MFS family permease